MPFLIEGALAAAELGHVTMQRQKIGGLVVPQSHEGGMGVIVQQQDRAA